MIFSKRFAPFSTLFFCFLISFTLFAQDAVVDQTEGPTESVLSGEKLFTANCASCHKLNKKLIGPALTGSVERWDEDGEYNDISGKDWLYKWVRNPNAVIAEGHPYANKIFKEYNKSVMTAFPSLTDEDVDNIFAYIANPPLAVVPKTDGGGAATQGAPIQDLSLFLYILIGMLVLIVLILGRVSSALGKLALVKEGLTIPVPVPFYRNKKIITTLVLVLIIYIGYTTVNSAIDLGRQQGYGPTQPIKFSHELHAGIDKIDCQYCHTGAAEGKQSNIPSLNICMNCHKGINEGVINGVHGRKEISKIYASIGFDPMTLSYVDDWENLPREEAEAVIEAWLNDDTEREYSDNDVEEVLQHVQQPIEWVRVHNLPDHVYFNHSQHVVAGELECQTCHGPVEEMGVLYQYSPLSMSWCISCHRSEEVNFTSNDYYRIYDKFHDDLKSGQMDKVTVESIGGTECQKCHY